MTEAEPGRILIKRWQGVSHVKKNSISASRRQRSPCEVKNVISR